MHAAALKSVPRLLAPAGHDAPAARLDAVFQALSDPIRRELLQRLDGQALLVSELAEPYEISLQAVSRHIQVLVRAGLVSQERSGRISRCSLTAGPLLDAAVWLNRYTHYWQQQFEALATTLTQLDAQRAGDGLPRARKRRAPATRNRSTGRQRP
jgi:DNA-binding transcriptional ArsR family regulator